MTRGKGKGAEGGKAGGTPLRELLRVGGGARVDLGAYDSSAIPAGPTDKDAGRAATDALAGPLAGLQERLYAAGTAGDRRRLLLVLQGMDTSGKGGTVKHVTGPLNPAGCRVTAFKAPTAEEREHPFLWRVEKALPRQGEIGVFDRSHYEDVLIARVRALVAPEVVERRYEEINAFERSLAEDGVTVVKVFLHIGFGEQLQRLLRRLDRPDKRWKFDPGDIEERRMWPAYQEAYERVLERCSPAQAPWYVVPADRKWYRNWAVARLLLEHLEEMDPRYPAATFDVEACRARLIAG
ncbi:PPK2 family polyphosphate kinase [Streptomyces katrae]|uniref:PPK2 family polyphosphate kinase n=1 Tax=Streptomyces katrae TaxID=68223 RepID=UPI0009A4BC77|nr:PPK2 family polyphosphate kinase [Streptomyces katrae]